MEASQSACADSAGARLAVRTYQSRPVERANGPHPGTPHTVPVQAASDLREGSAVRPMLNPALSALWRDEQTLQLGVDPERAVVLTGVDPRRASFLALLDGSRSRAQLLGAAADAGLSEPEARALLDLLGACDTLLDGGTDQRQLFRSLRLRSVTALPLIWRLGRCSAAGLTGPNGPGRAGVPRPSPCSVPVGSGRRSWGCWPPQASGH